MPGHGNKVLPILRGPSGVPEFMQARYTDMMWGKDPPADVRLVPCDDIDAGRSAGSGAHRWFDAYVRQHLSVNREVSCHVIPGGALRAVLKSSRSVSLVGGPGP